MTGINDSRKKRIVKNTALLYTRMLFLMLVGLYTSRVVLQTLGIDDYGIYNVIGSFVSMFSVLSAALSSATSRFLNFEMGRGETGRLSNVFSTSVNIHIILAIIVAFVCEVVGIWFVNNMMVVSAARLTAANWVFQISVLTFCSKLITVPYDAALIAHEKMDIYAYISIFEGLSSLAIAFAIKYPPMDTLVFYAVLVCAVQIIVRLIFQFVCTHRFEECRYHFVYDKELTKEMFGFAGWNFIGAASATLRNQGGNILINLFFGPIVNAARAVASQVLRAVSGFSQNFMTATRPQITQNYASGDYKFMMKLIFKGARINFYLLFVLSLPIFLNSEWLLNLWLADVPAHSALFVQLILIFALIESLSQTLITAQLAAGNIRNYQLVVGGIQLMNLPISYVVYKLGGAPESFVIVAIICGICCLCARLVMIRPMINLKISKFLKEVILNVLLVAVASSVVPVILKFSLPENTISVLLQIFLSVLISSLCIYSIGLSEEERRSAKKWARNLMRK